MNDHAPKNRDKSLDLLKLTALASMVLDHLRYIYPDYQNNFITMGRWAFPLFALLIATNTFHAINANKTDTLKRYAINLIIFAFLSELPYRLMSGNTPTFNIMPTLLLGFVLILLLTYSKAIFQKIFIIIASGIGLFFFGNYLEYGLFGVFLIVLLFLSISTSHRLMSAIYFILAIIFALLSSLQYYYPLISILGLFNSYTTPVIISIVLAMFYSKVLTKIHINIAVPKIGKWVWWFYPVHMLVIFLIAKYLGAL